MKEKRSYEAPKIRLVKFDENDILRTSGSDFNCSGTITGNSRDSSCDIHYHTDNSSN